MSRKEFMKKLSTDLTTPWMQERLQAPTRTLRDNITNVLKNVVQPSPENISDEPELKKQHYCGFCSYKKGG